MSMLVMIGPVGNLTDGRDWAQRGAQQRHTQTKRNFPHLALPYWARFNLTIQALV
jgi:hypothetical protein